MFPFSQKVCDVRRVSILACTFLVVLRLSIGWQFFYEGIWKFKTLSTATPWTSAGYLKTSKGPLRNYFRGMVEDPDDLDKLDFDKVAAKWDQWRDSFLAHHPDLKADQKDKLDKSLADLKERLQTELKKWASVVNEKYKGTVDEKTKGEIELYKNMLERYEAKLVKAEQDFQREHLDKLWGEIQAKRSMLVGPVNALTAELQSLGNKYLTLEQLNRGPPPATPTETDRVDLITIWGLLICGTLLIAGLFSRSAALGAACLLTMFYLAVPPWPGVPEAPGPEHSLIVNKNFIEIVACLALACLPTGRWMGLDAWIHRFVLRKTTD